VSKEIPPPIAYDVDMFSGQLRDTRSDKQKKDDFARQFKQPLMFSQGEISQFGVNPHPLMPISDKTRLGLEMFDARTDEEKERDLEREAQKHTYQLFPSDQNPVGVYLCVEVATPITDPRRLLAAHSVVPDPNTQHQEYLAERARVEQRAGEHLLYLRLLYEQPLALKLPDSL
jgi:hypothetical protein